MTAPRSALTDGAYNAHVLTENKGGTLIELSDGSVVTLDVFSPAPEEYDENNLFRNYPGTARSCGKSVMRLPAAW